MKNLQFVKILACLYMLISINLFAAAPGISLSPITITEGNSGILTITLDTPARPGGEIVVITVKDETTDPSDYNCPSQVFIPEGETIGNLVITANLDGTSENLETLQIGAYINHVLNAAFEDGANNFTPLSGYWEDGNPYRFEVNPENTYFSNGSSNGVIEIDSESQGFQDLTLNPGVEYTVGFKAARRANFRTINDMDLKISILESGNLNHVISEREIRRDNTDDTFEEFSFTIPATNTVSNIRIMFSTDLLNRLLTENDGNDSKTFGMILDNLTISLSAASDLSNADAVTTVTIKERDPSIGFNFTGNDTNNELPSSYIVGKIPQANWNNIITKDTSASNLNDSSGTATTVDIVLTDFKTEKSINQNGSVNGDKLFQGLFELRNKNSRVSINEIPYDNYDVYVYIGSTDNGQGEIQVSGANESYFSKFGDQETFSDFIVSTDTTGPPANSSISNTIHFKGLSLSSIDIDLIYNLNRIGIHGIQIVQTPRVTTKVENYTTAKNQPLSISPTLGVLANDVNAASATLDQDVSNGTLSLNSDGGFSYTPASNFIGEDTFTYRAIRADGLYQSDPVLVTISVGLPTVANPDSYGVPKNGELRTTFPGVLVNDQSATSAAKVTDPSHGYLDFENDGTFKYIPDANYLGEDSFTYKALDGVHESDPTTVTITVVDAAATSVGINFHEAGAGEMAATESAGYSRQKNWNNISTIDTTNYNMIDFAGMPTNITVETMNFTANNSGAETFEGVNNGNDDEKLFKGLFKTNQRGWKDYVQVSGIPYENYDVYIYLGSDNGGYGDIKITGGTTFYNKFGNNDPFVSYSICTDTIGPAENSIIRNTIHFGEVTSSTFTISMNKISNRIGIHGIQIVKVIPTPVVGFDAMFDSEELTWSIESEIGVKEYQIYINGRYYDTVMATGEKTFSYLLPEGVESVAIKVVDFDGYFQIFNVSNDQSLNTNYSINKGWNLISIVGDDADLSNLENLGTIWTWNGSNYQKSNQVEAYHGIWVKSPVTTNIVIKSQKSKSAAVLKLGWNLMGPANNVTAPKNQTIYSWGKNNNYILNTHNILLQGVGYWIFSTSEKEIELK